MSYMIIRNFTIAQCTRFFLCGCGLFLFWLLFNWVQIIIVFLTMLLSLTIVLRDVKITHGNRVKIDCTFNTRVFACMSFVLYGVLFCICIYGLFVLLCQLWDKKTITFNPLLFCIALSVPITLMWFDRYRKRDWEKYSSFENKFIGGGRFGGGKLLLRNTLSFGLVGSFAGAFGYLNTFGSECVGVLLAVYHGETFLFVMSLFLYMNFIFIGVLVHDCPCPSTVRMAESDDGEAKTGENTKTNKANAQNG